MRELIQKGDPSLRVQLPMNVIHMLRASAKQNKRKLQDEIIKRLYKSFRYPDALIEVQFDLLQQATDLTEKWVQVISLDIMEALNAASAQKNLSLGEEVVSRLLATLKYPQEFGFNPIGSAILMHKFSPQEAMTEIKHRQEAWGYLYEVEKLRLFLEFETKLPRHIKENFKSIDVKAVSKQIRAEMKAKAKNTAE